MSIRSFFASSSIMIALTCVTAANAGNPALVQEVKPSGTISLAGKSGAFQSTSITSSSYFSNGDSYNYATLYFKVGSDGQGSINLDMPSSNSGNVRATWNQTSKTGKMQLNMPKAGVPWFVSWDNDKEDIASETSNKTGTGYIIWSSSGSTANVRFSGKVQYKDDGIIKSYQITGNCTLPIR